MVWAYNGATSRPSLLIVFRLDKILPFKKRIAIPDTRWPLFHSRYGHHSIQKRSLRSLHSKNIRSSNIETTLLYGSRSWAQMCSRRSRLYITLRWRPGFGHQSLKFNKIHSCLLDVPRCSRRVASATIYGYEPISPKWSESRANHPKFAGAASVKQLTKLSLARAHEVFSKKWDSPNKLIKNSSS